jgi:hypothetical protein
MGRRFEAGEITQEEMEAEFNELSRQWTNQGAQACAFPREKARKGGGPRPTSPRPEVSVAANVAAGSSG